MNGVIKALVPTSVDLESGKRKGGFGFILDEVGDDRFFHANDVRGTDFNSLTLGQRVQFDPLDTGVRANKLRAYKVRLNESQGNPEPAATPRHS